MYQPSFTTKPDAIEAELAEMQEFLEMPSAGDQPEQMKERLNKLAQFMARSGKLKADAEWHYSNLYQSSLMGAIKQMAEAQMSTSTVNEYLKSVCKDYKVLVTWADRVNRSCVHQMDSLRTLISYAKQERHYQ